MRSSLKGWWRANRWVVAVTVVVAVVLGVGFGLWAGPRAGALVAGGVVALMGMLALSSATMLGAEQTLDRQIAMRERRTSRPPRADVED